MTSNTEETATPKLLQRASRRRPASRNVRARLRPPRPSRRSPLTSSPTGRFRDMYLDSFASLVHSSDCDLQHLFVAGRRTDAAERCCWFALIMSAP